uniref:CBS domain-containing protein n=1 Tax=Trypanosoma congolense (strain IL3000) TaxID=1068625 RepID=G0UVX7_TRYCI|nr:conserved hypothetical protein [Trypanosoma congolense IL3000]
MLYRGGALDPHRMYIAASGRARCSSVSGIAAASTTSSNFEQQQQQLSDINVILEAEYYPTDEECKQLAAPITDLLSQCTCYEMLGTSTQVAVLDVDAKLTVAFIAAQETRLVACVLWDPIKRVFCGVLSSTDYIEILLYCNYHPDEAERVADYTIREWREKIRDCKTGSCGAGNGVAHDIHVKPFDKLSSFPPVPPLVTCSPTTPLSECLGKIMQHNAKRIIILVEKEDVDVSIVALLDLQQILSYLGALFLSIESTGAWRQGSGTDTVMSSSITSQTTSDCAEGAGSGALEAVSGYRPLLDTVGASDFERLMGNVTFPLHVRNLLLSVAGEDRESPVSLGKHARVGPYRVIVDVPFCFVPQLGQHRNTVISVKLETLLVQALELLLMHNIDCIAVVSDEQIVIDAIGRSDIVRIEDQGVYDTKLTVREALSGRSAMKIRVFHEKDTLRDIFIHFVRQRVRELFLVDPDTDRLLGQLNISEIVFFLVFGITNNNNPSKSLCGCGNDLDKACTVPSAQ